jgi:hypothetical protein
LINNKKPSSNNVSRRKHRTSSSFPPRPKFKTLVTSSVGLSASSKTAPLKTLAKTTSQQRGRDKSRGRREMNRKNRKGRGKRNRRKRMSRQRRRKENKRRRKDKKMRRKGRKWKMKKAGLMMKKTRTIRNLPRNSSTRIRIRSYINLVKNSQLKRIRNNKKLKKQRRHLRFRKLKNPRKLKNSGRDKVNKLKNRQKF